ncbi:protein of unknown function [Burkholderia multivorans]
MYQKRNFPPAGPAAHAGRLARRPCAAWVRIELARSLRKRARGSRRRDDRAIQTIDKFRIDAGAAHGVRVRSAGG